MSTNFLFSKICWQRPAMFCTLHLKETFPPIIWIFIEGEGDEIKSKLPFKIFSTLSDTVCNLSRPDPKSKGFFLTFYMNSYLEMWPSTFNQLVTLQFNMHGFNLPYRDARALKCLYTQPHQRCVDNYRLRHLWCCIFNSFNQLHTYLFIRNCTKSFTHRFRIIQRQNTLLFYQIEP